MKQTYEGARLESARSIPGWVHRAGEGRRRLLVPPERPDPGGTEFFKPFAGTTRPSHLKPAGNQTMVTWNMFGENNFMAKAIHLFMNMDKMIGDQFEKGLADMKAIAEATAKK
jgi:hypothetical protein